MRIRILGVVWIGSYGWGMSFSWLGGGGYEKGDIGVIECVCRNGRVLRGEAFVELFKDQILEGHDGAMELEAYLIEPKIEMTRFQHVVDTHRLGSGIGLTKADRIRLFRFEGREIEESFLEIVQSNLNN